MIRKARAAGLAAGWLVSVTLLGSAVCGAAAQASANGRNPPEQNSADKQTDKPAGDSVGTPAGNSGARTAPPSGSTKPRIITNDDINADRARHHEGFGVGRNAHAIPGTGECDDRCADEARDLAGFGPDQEGEWRFALTAARRNLAADTAWPAAYVTLARAVKTYCTFHEQVQATATPSGNDYGSRVERARQEKYVEDMGRVLGQTVDNAKAQIERMAQQADDNEEPARGAILRVLAERVNDSCGP
jgi:hypothetical protein